MGLRHYAAGVTGGRPRQACCQKAHSAGRLLRPTATLTRARGTEAGLRAGSAFAGPTTKPPSGWLQSATWSEAAKERKRGGGQCLIARCDANLSFLGGCPYLLPLRFKAYSPRFFLDEISPIKAHQFCTKFL